MLKFIPNWDISRVEGEAAKAHYERLATGFYNKYLGGDLILDIGYKGGLKDALPVLPYATGVDLDYPGYDGLHLPFPDNHVDGIFSSHCLEHLPDPISAIRDWWRTLKVGCFMVITVPHMWLYEKKPDLPSRFNGDHKRFYTPARLLSEIETALQPNSYRVRSLRDFDRNFDYALPPEQHSCGQYEIELVLEKILQPEWTRRLTA